MQLTIFDQLKEITNPDDIVTEKANSLLDLLNDGVRKKERYEPQYYFYEKKYIVLIAANKNKNVLFNIIDGTSGEIPNGFSVNWRTLQHIKQELNLN